MPAWISSRLVQGLLILAAIAAVAASIDVMVSRIDARGYERAEADGNRKIADLKADQLEALRKAEAAARERFEAQNRNMLRLSERLIAASTTIDKQTKQLQERAKNVSTLYRPQPDAALVSVPGWIVTHGWVCDYNRAIGYDMSGSGAGVGGTQNPSCATDPFGRSAVTGERILIHHEEYGGYCRKLEEQVNHLIDHLDFIEGNGKADGGGDARSR